MAVCAPPPLLRERDIPIWIPAFAGKGLTATPCVVSPTASPLRLCVLDIRILPLVFPILLLFLCRVNSLAPFHATKRDPPAFFPLCCFLVELSRIQNPSFIQHLRVKYKPVIEMLSMMVSHHSKHSGILDLTIFRARLNLHCGAGSVFTTNERVDALVINQGNVHIQPQFQHLTDDQKLDSLAERGAIAKSGHAHSSPRTRTITFLIRV